MASARRKKTRWGDKDSRRRDIMDAARSVLARTGYERLTMRDVARGAKTSLGLVYAYFESREELFAALYVERLRAFKDEIAPHCEEAPSLVRLFVDIADAYLEVYRVFGRELNAWVSLAEGAELSPEVARPLIDTSAEITAMIALGIDRAARREGVRLAAGVDRELVLPFLWAALGGLADHYTGGRHRVHPFPWSRLAEFAARTLVKGLTERPKRRKRNDA